MTTQVYNLEVKVIALKTEKNELLKLIKSNDQSDAKLKRKITENEQVLEEKLKEAELKLNLALERNNVMDESQRRFDQIFEVDYIFRTSGRHVQQLGFRKKRTRLCKQN